MMRRLSSSSGGFTVTGWKRRTRLRSLSMYFTYSLCVVAPMHWISPRLRAGFRMLAASRLPSAAPVPMRLWISSMKSTTEGSLLASAMMDFSRSSNWPRYLVPATTRLRSSA